MIISASRRTDIPAFFGEWFVNRLKEKKVLVRNPLNKRRITEIALDQTYIDCIVFWTKNPRPFLQYLPIVDDLGHRYYFQFTITPYDNRIEKNGNKTEIIDAFIELSERIGKEKVIWRYDPIFINQEYSLDYHVSQFELLCKQISKYTEKCVISFIDTYTFLNDRFKLFNITEVSNECISELMGGMTGIANTYTVPLASCSEKIDLRRYGVSHNKCIDDELIERLFFLNMNYKKDASQRLECGCCVSRDIGAYNTCLHDCIYCYAKRGKRLTGYDPASPLLGDAVTGNDTITTLDMKPIRFNEQFRLHPPKPA